MYVIKKVLDNLIGNALKFTEHSEVVLSVGMQNVDRHGRGMIRASVQDIGIRIPPDKIYRDAGTRQTGIACDQKDRGVEDCR